MLVSLLIEEGFEGYGLYWAILEVLRDAPQYRYNPDSRVWAYVLHARDVDQVERILTKYGLFDTDDNGLLFSPWLIEQLETYDNTRRKRQEAGKRGAASRWGISSSRDGNAIAKPSLDDGNAIAYNQTNITNSMQDNEIPSMAGGVDIRLLCQEQGAPVSTELLQTLCDTQQEGHAPGYIAQVCLQYKMGENVLNFLCERTNNAEVTHPIYKQFVALVRRIQAEKYPLKYPANFFLTKLFPS